MNLIPILIAATAIALPASARPAVAAVAQPSAGQGGAQPPPPPGPPPSAPPSRPPAPPTEQLRIAVPTRAMSLPDALEYARKNQPSLLAAKARLAAIRAETDIPRALYLPRVTATAQVFGGTENNTTAMYTATYGIDVPRIGATAVGPTSMTPYASTLAGVGLRQEIFDFGRISALQEAADAAAEAERGRTDTTRLDVLYSVENAFYSVQTAKGVLGAAEAAWSRSKLDYDTAVAGVMAGLREPIERTRAEATLGRFEVARVRARAGVATAQALFAAVVGVPETMLDTLGEAAPPAPSPTLQQAISSAFDNDPVLHVRRALVVEQSARTRSIAAELRPDISLTTTFTGRAGDATPTNGTLSDGSGFLPNVPNWDTGLVFTWPLLDFGVKARENASRAMEDARQSEVQERLQVVSAWVQRTYLDVVAAEQALPGLEKTLAAAQANYEQAEARFRNELGSSVELSDAQALLTSAEVDLTIGKFELLKARADLGRAVAENL